MWRRFMKNYLHLRGWWKVSYHFNFAKFIFPKATLILYRKHYNFFILIYLSNKIKYHKMLYFTGHPGQDESSSMEIPPLKGNEHLYDIHGQIASKSEFIKRYIPPHIKVHLVGHSLGTYTAIKLLKDSEIRDKLQKCYLIFPTIRGRDDGKNLNCSISEVFIWFYTYFGFILKLLCQVPECLKISVFKLFCWVCSTSTDLLDGFLRISKPEVMDKTVYLIKTSIQCIRFKEADIELLEENKKLLKFYYGSKDGWVPLEFYRELKNSIPDIDAEIDTYNIEHGILWKSSSIMAEILSKMVKDNKC